VLRHHRRVGTSAQLTVLASLPRPHSRSPFRVLPDLHCPTPGPDAAGAQPRSRVAARLRRAGPPALRPGTGLRRPRLRHRTPATPGCPAGRGVPSRTGGNQTAPGSGRSYVRWGAPPSRPGRGPAERSLRDGMPLQPIGGPLFEDHSWAVSGPSGRWLGRQTPTNDDQHRPVLTYETPAHRPVNTPSSGGRRTSRPVRRILCRRPRGRRRRPSISACRCRQAPAAYPQARASSPRAPAPAVALAGGGLAWPCSGWGLPSHPGRPGCW
jgi:hypothetical protein